MDPSFQSIDDPHQKKMKADATGDRPMETVGVYLKRERESKNLSLQEVARLTKISELYLDCIEKDDYDKIPKGPYVKGYISSYARMIGSDTEQALRLYESLNSPDTQEDETAIVAPSGPGWKAGLMTAVSSMVDWFNQRKNRPSATVSTALRETASTAAALFGKPSGSHGIADAGPANSPGDENAIKPESSVLIPFKRFARPELTRTPVADALPPSNPFQRGSAATRLLSACKKVADRVPWQKSGSLMAAADRWPVRPGTVLAATIALALGGAFLFFCAIGIYHVFFYDPPAALTGESTFVTAGNQAAPPASEPPLTVPHKTIRFKKPDPPLPSIAPVLTSAPESSTAPAPSIPAPALPVADQEAPMPEKPQVSTTDTPVAEAPSVNDTALPHQPAPNSLKVLKATICSAIKDRMPADVAASFPLSVERVYVWTHVQADHYPTVIRHVFFHDGQMIDQVELNVRSAFWRTWSFKSIDKDSYVGHWRVDITAGDGTLLRRLYFEIN